MFSELIHRLAGYFDGNLREGLCRAPFTIVDRRRSSPSSSLVPFISIFAIFILAISNLKLCTSQYLSSHSSLITWNEIRWISRGWTVAFSWTSSANGEDKGLSMRSTCPDIVLAFVILFFISCFLCAATHTHTQTCTFLWLFEHRNKMRANKSEWTTTTTTKLTYTGNLNTLETHMMSLQPKNRTTFAATPNGYALQYIWSLCRICISIYWWPVKGNKWLHFSI